MKIDSGTIEQALQAADNPRLVDTRTGLHEAAQAWGDCTLLGVDTEFLRERTYRAELGLVQVSDGRTAWLVDTITLDDLEILKALLTDPAKTKVFHSASEDLEVLWNTLGVTPGPMADTQIGCAMLGQPLQMSYHNAVKWMTGIETDKEQTRSDWIRRPLTARQLHYAATDVTFLPAMYQNVHAALKALGRWPWLEEDVGRMIGISKLSVDYDTAYLRINGHNRLDDTALHALKALAAWREKTAVEQNRARTFVVPDTVLLQLAQTLPETSQGLGQVEGMHPRALQKYQREIMKIISQSKSANGPIERESSLDGAQRRMLNVMRNAVQKQAATLDIDPGLLASRKQLEGLLRALGSGQAVPERLTGWRFDVITKELLNLAAGNNTG